MNYRYYRLDRTEGGPLPVTSRMQVGAIIRVPSTKTKKPGAQWNPSTQCWVAPVWVECADPSIKGQA